MVGAPDLELDLRGGDDMPSVMNGRCSDPDWKQQDNTSRNTSGYDSMSATPSPGTPPFRSPQPAEEECVGNENGTPASGIVDASADDPKKKGGKKFPQFPQSPLRPAKRRRAPAPRSSSSSSARSPSPKKNTTALKDLAKKKIKKYTIIRSKQSKADKLILDEMKNPKPSTSAPLMREQERIRRAMLLKKGQQRVATATTTTTTTKEEKRNVKKKPSGLDQEDEESAERDLLQTESRKRLKTTPTEEEQKCNEVSKDAEQKKLAKKSTKCLKVAVEKLSDSWLESMKKNNGRIKIIEKDIDDLFTEVIVIENDSTCGTTENQDVLPPANTSTVVAVPSPAAVLPSRPEPELDRVNGTESLASPKHEVSHTEYLLKMKPVVVIERTKDVESRVRALIKKSKKFPPEVTLDEEEAAKKTAASQGQHSPSARNSEDSHSHFLTEELRVCVNITPTSTSAIDLIRRPGRSSRIRRPNNRFVDHLH